MMSLGNRQGDHVTKIVVTGAAGFIGSHLCNKLSKFSDTQVLGIDNLRAGDWGRLHPSVERLSLDISTVTNEEWRDILKGTDLLFHLAAEKYNSSRSSPDQLIRTNVFGTQRLFASAALSKVKRTVFASSLYAYGLIGSSPMNECDVPQPHTLYGASKLMGEGIARSIGVEHGLSWNVARLFFIYGPRQHADGGYKSVILKNLERIKAQQTPTVFGSGTQVLDYVYIDDCTDALISLGLSNMDRMIVNVSTGTGISVRNLIDLLFTITDSTSKDVLNLPPDWTDGTIRVGLPNQIMTHFGWVPRTTIDQGLKEVWKWMKESD